jgi:hypothetical protein
VGSSSRREAITITTKPLYTHLFWSRSLFPFGALRLWKDLGFDVPSLLLDWISESWRSTCFLHRVHFAMGHTHDIPLSTRFGTTHLLVTFATIPSFARPGVHLYLSPVVDLSGKSCSGRKVWREECDLLIPYSYHTCFFVCCKTHKITFRRII